MEYICGVTFCTVCVCQGLFKPGAKESLAMMKERDRRKFRDICAWRVTGDTAVGGDLLHIKGDDGR